MKFPAFALAVASIVTIAVSPVQARDNTAAHATRSLWASFERAGFPAPAHAMVASTSRGMGLRQLWASFERSGFPPLSQPTAVELAGKPGSGTPVAN